MLSTRKHQQSRSHIGAGTKILGACTFQGELQVDGEIIGNVTAEGGRSTLVLAEPARIEGEIEADCIIISGNVIGPVHARDTLELKGTAHVQGNVRYKTLSMQPGAIITGQLQPQFLPPPVSAEPAADPALDPAMAPNTEPTIDPAALAASKQNGAPRPMEPTEPTLDPNRPLDFG